MRIVLLLFLLSFTFSCATRNIQYDRNKILKKFSTDYEMFVDNKKMDLENVYLNKENIENVHIDKQAKEIRITQFKPTEFFELKNLNLDSLSVGQRAEDKRKIALIIIDGIILAESTLEKTKIDPNAVKSFTIVSSEIMERTNFCRAYDGSILLIQTKE